MRWTTGDRGNVQDLRGGGGGMGIPLGIGGVLVLLVGSWLTGVNLFDIVGSGTSSSVSNTAESRPASSTPQEEQLVDFVDAVMGDSQKTRTQ
jgi:predicted metalloprotease